MITVTPFSALSADEIAFWRNATSERTICSSPFFQYDFAAAVNRACHDVHVVCQHNKAGEIQSLLPLQKRRRLGGLLPYWQRLGGEMSDYFGPISNGTTMPPLQDILSSSPVHRLNYSHLVQNHGQHYAGQTDLASGIVLTDGPDAYFEWLATANKKFYKDTLRREKKCIKEKGELKYHFSVTNEQVLQQLIEHKRAQYSRTNVKDSLEQSWKQALLFELLKNPLSSSDFRAHLSTLYCGDTWVALHFGIYANGTLQYWFPVYNPEFRPYAPGRLLLFATIRQAAVNNIQLIDRGQGFSDAKKDTANLLQRMNKHFYQSTSVFGSLHGLVDAAYWRLGKLE